MPNESIPAEDVFREWRKDPEYVREYDALEEEFTLASAQIKLRNRVTDCRTDIAEVSDASTEYRSE